MISSCYFILLFYSVRKKKLKIPKALKIPKLVNALSPIQDILEGFARF